jgi:hypothetical protein
MEDLLGQIRRALQANLYYAALFPVLALPDICGALESPDGEANKPKYAAWFDKWVAQRYRGTLTGDDCYYLRCSLLHQGTTRHAKSTYSRVLFLEPNTIGFAHNNILMDALNIDLPTFCADMIDGVEAWLPQAIALPHFQTNMSRFITRYPNGLRPYIVGVPVIA